MDVRQFDMGRCESAEHKCVIFIIISTGLRFFPKTSLSILGGNSICLKCVWIMTLYPNHKKKKKVFKGVTGRIEQSSNSN